jgi:predicted alpha/beta-hydrolase family hydrolase
MEITTPRGIAWADVTLPGAPGRADASVSGDSGSSAFASGASASAEPRAAIALLVLGHGAGGGVGAPDLVAVRDAVLGAGVATALVTQPYRVAGRRAPAPAGQLDEAWSAVLATLTGGAHPGTPPPGVPLIVGGRSSGARVACRTAVTVGAAGIVALAFPTHPPGRPERSRVGELDTGLPTLVVNGDRDSFGLPTGVPAIDLVVRPGERHDLRGDPAGVADVVLRWLRQRGWAR